MAAVNITGTVFQDLTDNGFNTGIDLNLSGVTIALFRDGGNTSYDSGTGTVAAGDDLLVATTTSAITTGLYSFQVSTAGTYFIVQSSVASGLIQRSSQRVQTVIVTATDIVGIGLLTIDSFDTTAHTVNAVFGGTNPDFDASAATEAIGGERDLFVNATSGTISMQADTPSTTNYLAFDNGAGANGTRILSYDGVDNDAQVLATSGLAGLDLTSAGSATGFRFQIGGEAGTTITIQVNSGFNASTHTVAIPTTTGASPTAILDVLFSDFTTSSGTGANFASVGAIQISVTGPNASDAIIDNIGTFGNTTIIRNIANLTPMSIGNLVFSDRNNNGLFDTAAPTEVGVSNVTLQLFTDTNNNGEFNPGTDVATLDSTNQPITTTSNGSGIYTFTNLFPGRYFTVIPISQFLTGAAAAGFVVSSTTPTATNNTNKGTAVVGTGVVTSLVTLNAGAAPTADGDSNANTDFSFDIGLVPQFDLTVAKTSTATVATTGSTITYTVTARNDGPSPASGVTLSDDIPDGLRIITATSSNDADVVTIPPTAIDTTAANPDSITVDVGFLAASATTQRTITIVAEVLPLGTGAPADLVNIVTIEGLGTELATLPNTATLALPVQLRNDLVILKTITTEPASTVFPATAIPGSTFTYTIIARNDGPSDATTVRVVDDIPDGIRVVSALSSDVTDTVTIPPSAQDTTARNADNIIIDVGNLGVGAGNQTTITIVGVVLAATQGNFTNVATISATDAVTNVETVTNNNTSSVTANAPRTVDLTIAKSAPVTAISGNTITYTMTATNNGPSDAIGVQVVDNIPDGIRVISATVNGNTATIPASASDAVASNPDDIIFSVGSIAAAGSNNTIIVVAAILPASTATLVNSASISTTDTATVDTPTNNNSTSVTTTLTQQNDVAITKTGPTSAVAGGIITYTMNVTNNGPSTATSVNVLDTLPAGVTFVSGTSLIESTAAGTVTFGPNNTASVTIPALAPGETAVVQILTIALATAPILLTNTVAVTATNDTFIGNNTATATTILTQQIVAVEDRAVILEDSGPAKIDVIANDLAPPGPNKELFSFTQASVGTVTRDDNGTPADTSDDQLVYTPPENFFGNVSFTYQIQVGGLGSIPTTGSVVIIVQEVNDPPVAINRMFDGIENTLLQLTGPALTSGLSKGPFEDSQSLVVTNATLSNPATGTVSLSQNGDIVFTPARDFTGQATIAYTVTDNGNSIGSPDPKSSSASITINVAAVQNQFDVAIVATGPSTINAGEEIVYTLNVTNNGPGVAQNILVNDQLPIGLTFVSGTSVVGSTPFDIVSSTGSTVSVTIASLSPGDTGVVTIRALVRSSQTGTLSNTSVVVAPGDSNLQNNSSSVFTSIFSQPSVSFTMSGTPQIASRSEYITYTLILEKPSPNFASNATIRDTLPAGLDLASVTTTLGRATLSQGSGNNPDSFVVDIPLSRSASSGSFPISSFEGFIATVTVVAKILPTFVGSSFVNVAYAALDNDQPIEASATIFVRGQSDLRITGTGPSETAVGSTITYLLGVFNDGPDTAQSVQVMNKLPDGIRVLRVVVDGMEVSIPATLSDSNILNPDGLVLSFESLPSTERPRIIEIDAIVLASDGKPLLGTALILSSDSSVIDSNPNNNSVSLETSITQTPTTNPPEPPPAPPQITYPLEKGPEQVSEAVPMPSKVASVFFQGEPLSSLDLPRPAASNLVPITNELDVVVAVYSAGTLGQLYLLLDAVELGLPSYSEVDWVDELPKSPSIQQPKLEENKENEKSATPAPSSSNPRGYWPLPVIALIAGLAGGAWGKTSRRSMSTRKRPKSRLAIENMQDTGEVWREYYRTRQGEL